MHDELTVGVVKVSVVVLEADRADLIQHPEGAQGAQAVARLVDADPVHRQLGLDLDQVDFEALLAEGDRRAEAADSRAQDQNFHRSLPIRQRMHAYWRT